MDSPTPLRGPLVSHLCLILFLTVLHIEEFFLVWISGRRGCRTGMPSGRVVYEVTRETQVSGGGRGYPALAVRGSFQVSLGLGDSPVEWNNIHIEGDARHIVRALRDALSIIEGEGARLVTAGRINADWNEGREWVRSKHPITVNMGGGEEPRVPAKVVP